VLFRSQSHTDSISSSEAHLQPTFIGQHFSTYAMTSGFGIRGGLGRCYHFWADFKECKAEHERLPGTCYAEREDYFECLHSKKEYLQVAKVNDQVKINEQKAKEAEKTAKAGGAS